MSDVHGYSLDRAFFSGAKYLCKACEIRGDTTGTLRSISV